MALTPEKESWKGMRRRVKQRPKDSIRLRYYITLGITMCRRYWDSFDAFIQDVGFKPSPIHSIDRVNNLGGYWCGKCEECVTKGWQFNLRWATPKEQARNTRHNRLLTINGTTKTVAEWTEQAGLHYLRIIDRLHKGWPVDENLLQPPMKPFGRRQLQSKRMETEK